jgi:hypothetical protein
MTHTYSHVIVSSLLTSSGPLWYLLDEAVTITIGFTLSCAEVFSRGTFCMACQNNGASLLVTWEQCAHF